VGRSAAPLATHAHLQSTVNQTVGAGSREVLLRAADFHNRALRKPAPANVRISRDGWL
jgi:hypothetical protein